MTFRQAFIEDFWYQFEHGEIMDAELLEELTDLRCQVADAIRDRDFKSALPRTFDAMRLLDQAGSRQLIRN